MLTVSSSMSEQVELFKCAFVFNSKRVSSLLSFFFSFFSFLYVGVPCLSPLFLHALYLPLSPLTSSRLEVIQSTLEGWVDVVILDRYVALPSLSSLTQTDSSSL